MEILKKIKNFIISFALYVLSVVLFLTIFSSIAVLLQPEYLGKFIEPKPVETESVQDPNLPIIKVESHCEWLDDPPGMTEIVSTTIFALYKAFILIIVVFIIILIIRKKLSYKQIIKMAFFIALIAFLLLQFLLRNNLNDSPMDWNDPLFRIVKPLCF